MLPQDEQYVRNVCKFFYPDQTPPQTISDELGDLAAQMVFEAIKASKAMDLVPRPSGGKAGVFWLVSQAVQIVWRRLVNENKIYEAVRVTVARNFRTQYELLKNGV